MKKMSEPGFIGLKDYQDLPTTWQQNLFSLRVSSCNFVAIFLVIFIVVPHDAAASPGDE